MTSHSPLMIFVSMLLSLSLNAMESKARITQGPQLFSAPQLIKLRNKTIEGAIIASTLLTTAYAQDAAAKATEVKQPQIGGSDIGLLVCCMSCIMLCGSAKQCDDCCRNC